VIDGVQVRVFPPFARNHISETVDDVDAGHRIPIAVAVISGFDYSPHVVVREFSDSAKFQEIGIWSGYHTPRFPKVIL
jgi:hypothetical protein